MAGCHAQHQQTAFAKKKQHDAVFFVKSVDVLAAHLEVLPEIAGPLDVAILRVEFDSAKLLQMGGLCANQERIDVGNLDIADQSQEHAHPHP
jgi:hypothetical protein